MRDMHTHGRVLEQSRAQVMPGEKPVERRERRLALLGGRLGHRARVAQPRDVVRVRLGHLTQLPITRALAQLDGLIEGLVALLVGLRHEHVLHDARAIDLVQRLEQRELLLVRGLLELGAVAHLRLIQRLLQPVAPLPRLVVPPLHRRALLLGLARAHLHVRACVHACGRRS